LPATFVRPERPGRRPIKQGSRGAGRRAARRAWVLIQTEVSRAPRSHEPHRRRFYEGPFAACEARSRNGGEAPGRPIAHRVAARGKVEGHDGADAFLALCRKDGGPPAHATSRGFVKISGRPPPMMARRADHFRAQLADSSRGEGWYRLAALSRPDGCRWSSPSRARGDALRWSIRCCGSLELEYSAVPPAALEPPEGRRRGISGANTNEPGLIFRAAPRLKLPDPFHSQPGRLRFENLDEEIASAPGAPRPAADDLLRPPLSRVPGWRSSAPATRSRRFAATFRDAACEGPTRPNPAQTSRQRAPGRPARSRRIAKVEIAGGRLHQLFSLG